MLRHLLVGIAVVTSVSLTQAATLSPIIEASDLNALVQQQAVKIVDIRGDVKAFAQAHPGLKLSNSFFGVIKINIKKGFYRESGGKGRIKIE